MAESLFIPKNQSKKELYQALIPQIESVLDGEPDIVANLANVAAILKEAFGFFWVGFYLMKDGELVLGPFQGPLACTRIPLGKGVCGASAQQKKVLIVPDVEKFPGHIACSSLSRSEIVVPLIVDDKVLLVLDVDSVDLDSFDGVDEEYLVEVVSLLDVSSLLPK